MITITYYVHGTTPDNEHHIATGWLPGELSPLGLKQTAMLAEQDLLGFAPRCANRAHRLWQTV